MALAPASRSAKPPHNPHSQDTNTRITRSVARRAEDHSPDASAEPNESSARSLSTNHRKRSATTTPLFPLTPQLTSSSAEIVSSSASKRKRRPSNQGEQTKSDIKPLKRPKISSRQTRAGRNLEPHAMAKPGPSHKSSVEKDISPTGIADGSRRRSGKGKKTNHDTEHTPLPTLSASRKSKKTTYAKFEDTSHPKEGPLTPRTTTDDATEEMLGSSQSTSEEDGLSTPKRSSQEDEEDTLSDPFHGSLLGSSRGHVSMSETLRQLSGYVSGISSRLRDMLNQLRQKDDPSIQLIALQDLSELLLISNEDNLAGQFAPDQFVKELVALMRPDEFTMEENPEMMLLACRCLANLMEALPSSISSVVYGGAVPLLCEKLMEIHYIDLAEQALSTLEKISTEFPASIVRAGGLAACLNYLDFFATGTQRTAVTTAANCCKNIPHDSFDVIQSVMPNLLNVLSSSDQRVVEQGSICVSRVVESFKYEHDKLEQLVSPELLKAVLRLLQPGTTNLIGPSIHTQFLRVLSITAHASPKLSHALLEMDIVETLYQILTGISAPGPEESLNPNTDSIFVMQALIHRPREQITETLNVICGLLPDIQANLSLEHNATTKNTSTAHTDHAQASPNSLETSDTAKRLSSLEGVPNELRRFAVVLFPILTEAYSSTVNLAVRQKVLVAQMKMLSNLKVDLLEDALRPVPYASFLASILSQQDHASLVSFALQAADLLMQRMLTIYGYQVYREGVVAEIQKLANEPFVEVESKKADVQSPATSLDPITKDCASPCESQSDGPRETDNIEVVHDDEDAGSNDEDTDDNNDDGDDGDDDDDEEPSRIRENMSPSASESTADRDDAQQCWTSEHDMNVLAARKFLENHQGSKTSVQRDQAAKKLGVLRSLAQILSQDYTKGSRSSTRDAFQQLSKHFQGDALSTVTSSEILQSDLVDTLLDLLGSPKSDVRLRARADFLRAFTSVPRRSSISNNDTSPFRVFIYKLQDLLSRAEQFEVMTINQNAAENSRGSPSSMLSKQLRLRLFSDDQPEIPRMYSNLTISIHAIATFKALDDYLRPRINLAERTKSSRHREGMSNALAAFAAAAGLPLTQQKSKGLPDTDTEVSTAKQQADPVPSTLTGQVSRSDALAKVSTSEVAQKSHTTRRSSRRHKPATDTPSEPSEPLPVLERTQSPLECADEHQITDEEDLLGDGGTLDELVDDLNDELEDKTLADPTAVNMEVASTGKVIARKEDGTRVSTPSQGSKSLGGTQDMSAARTREPPTTLGSSAINRAMSYAAAIQSVPQDWHIEFTIDGQVVANDLTIYKAIHQRELAMSPSTPRSIWSSVHAVQFKRVNGPPPSETSLSASCVGVTDDNTGSKLPASLQEHPQTAKILRLLAILHDINTNLDEVIDEIDEQIKVDTEASSQFVSTKLTAKLNRQLEEPLIVASGSLPQWSADLARLFPFLFPFETRHLFLQSTSFGYARSMVRWQNQSAEESRRARYRDDRPFMGKLQRQKVRISRTRILESACKVMEIYGGSSSILEIEYFDEVGTGLGPTLEFYATISKEFSKKRTRMWRTNDADDNDEYAFGKNGLFPAPMQQAFADSENGKKVLYYFKMLGKFIARSMIDSRIVDVSLNPVFFRLADLPVGKLRSLSTVSSIDHHLAKVLRSLKQYAIKREAILSDSALDEASKTQHVSEITIDTAHLEDFGLDFTLPGYPSIELVPDGAQTNVTGDNVSDYVDRVLDFTLGHGVQQQIDHFKAGFSEVFAYSSLQAFTPSELVMLFGQIDEDWSIENLCDSIKADHGYNMDSKSVRNLLQVMSEFSLSQRRDFLQFVTGSPRLPIGGFKSLNPMFTVVCKPAEAPYTSDDFLVSVMTCANYVKLPDYSNIDILRAKLLTAISEGQGAFHLS